MTNLCCKVLEAFAGETLVTAESCTGGGIGSALTAIPGSSSVYKGGVICYSNWVKANTLQVPQALLDRYGPVSAAVAEAMARGVKELLKADAAVSVTGLAGPDGDAYGEPVGRVYIGCCVGDQIQTRKFSFQGDREMVRNSAIESALQMLLAMKFDTLNKEPPCENPVLSD